MSVDRKVNDERNISEGSENACVVCFKNVEIYSIGECDHPVCYECSTRMRVLCEQNECTICRKGLSKVIFTNEKRSYRDLEASNRSEYYNKKYKICFSNINIQKAFYDLLEHPCPRCDVRPFPSFDTLKDHVRKEHELFYCDICTEHLKIFSFERKCYNRQQLGTHRRVGDPDNTSHRGHPICHYCDCRYLDRDELFRHLRREHYYCHFCDADGANQFYSDYDSLREHFRNEHYLCEEGDCIREKFTVVFRTDIDLRAHIANVHGKSMGKLLAKQARTLQLEIRLEPRGRSNQQDQSARNLRSRGNNEYYEPERYEPHTVQNLPRTIDAQNEQEFPSLSGAMATSSAVTLIRPNMSIRTKAFGPAGLARTKENFPALGNTNTIPDTGPNLPGSSKYNQPPVSAILKNNTNVSQPKTKSGGSMVIHVSNRPNSGIQKLSNNMNNISMKKVVNQKDFPALPGSSRGHSTFLKDEDYVPANPSISLSSVSAKHRSLVDDYVSIAQHNSKLTFVQKDAEKEQPKKQIEQTFNASTNDFPALAIVAPPQEGNWVKTQKQQNKENRKSKVAPAPILNGPYLEPNIKKINEKKDSQKKSVDTEYNNQSNKKDNKKASKSNDKKTNDIKRTESTSSKSNESKQKSKEKKIDNNNENKTMNRNVSKMNVKNVENSSNHETKNSDFKKIFDQKDFPGLAKNSFSAPPPGFDVKLNGSKQPPPGFKSVTLNSVAKPSNHMTFTNSLGENYSIVPNHQYLKPPNLDKRNQELVKHFQNTLKSHDAVEEFRFISQKFREGLYKASPYFEHCQAALSDKFDEIFPELLVLLPDITKQQELFLVYSQYLKSKKQQKQRTKLEVCTKCKQILLNLDLKAHLQDHQIDNNFPLLSSSDSGSSITAGGVRK